MDGEFSLVLTNKHALLFILVISAIIVIDSTIIKFSIYTYKELPILINLGLFTGLSVSLSTIAIVLLRSIKKFHSKSKYNLVIHDRANIVVQVGQYTVIGFLAFTIIQMVFLNAYSALLTQSILFTSFVTSILFLILLVMLLAGWFISSKNYMIMAYVISFSIIYAYLIVSMIYVVLQFSYHSTWIEAHTIHFSLVNLVGAGLGLSFGVVLDILSLVSFVLVWLATVGLLRQYRNKIGRFRFWIIISIPLIYFLFPFETYFASYFQEVLSESPIFFSIIYIIFFSATKQVGGVLFSVVFLTAAAKIRQQNLRNYLIIAAIGIAILFSSTEINSLLYATYPPYGVLTIMLMPLGSYFLFIGLFASARFVSRDKGLRKEFYQTAERQLAFLKTIGKVQMEKELEMSLKSILKRSTVDIEIKDYYQDENDVREMVREVIQELRLKEPKHKHENHRDTN